MRIIAGKYRSRNLKTDSHFRPTTDRVRESLFNILQSHIDGSVFVDAFSGSGAVGIEALSRGARMAYFLETHQRALGVIEANLTQCIDGGAWRIYSMPAPRALEEVRKNEPSVDLIFFDPPYDFKGYTQLLAQSAMLFPEAMLILESSRRSVYEIPEGLEVVKDRVIGETRLAFFRADPLHARS